MEGTKNTKATLLNEVCRIVFVCGLKNPSDQRQKLEVKDERFAHVFVHFVSARPSLMSVSTIDACSYIFLKECEQRINHSNISDIHVYICINKAFETMLNNGIALTLSVCKGCKNANVRKEKCSPF